MTEKELKNLEVHEVRALIGDRQVMRVIGGWVYFDYYQGSCNSSVFVPEPKNNLTWKKY